MSEHELKNKVVVITGAGSGIGRSLARQFGVMGCRLAISDINSEALKETADMLSGGCLTELVDVSNYESVLKHADHVREKYGSIDIVINNAGADLAQYTEDVSIEDFRWIMDVNFWGVVYGTKAFLKHMINQGNGTIVNVSSILGIIGATAHGAYSASKFAVRGFTESLRQEMIQNKTGVEIICVHPGAIATNIAINGRFYKDHDGETDKQGNAEKLDRMAKVSADQAAEKIIQGIMQKQGRIMIGADAKFAEWLQRWCPVNYYKVFLFLQRSARFFSKKKLREV